MSVQLCDLKSLEILDIGRNELRVLPHEIVKLSSLKVLAAAKNQIQELPLCLADMASLKLLKLNGNDIVFPPQDVFQIQAASPQYGGLLSNEEASEVVVTSRVKTFLRQWRVNNPTGLGTGVAKSSEERETPQLSPDNRTSRRRFPVRVNRGPNLQSPNRALMEMRNWPGGTPIAQASRSFIDLLSMDSEILVEEEYSMFMTWASCVVEELTVLSYKDRQPYLVQLSLRARELLNSVPEPRRGHPTLGPISESTTQVQ
jgi:hypothetical protein